MVSPTLVRGMLRRGWSLAVFGVVASALSPAGAAGQSTPRALLTGPQFGIGFVANAPEEMAGGSAYVVFPAMGGIGLYVDAKFDTEDSSGQRGYVPDVTAADVESVYGGDFVQDEESWWSVDVALVRPLNPYLMVYGGAGLAHKAVFRQYSLDSDVEIGVGGIAWVEDPRGEEDRVNLMAGVIFRLSRWVSTQFGVESEPRGVTIGASLRLPPW